MPHLICRPEVFLKRKKKSLAIQPSINNPKSSPLHEVAKLGAPIEYYATKFLDYLNKVLKLNPWSIS